MIQPGDVVEFNGRRVTVNETLPGSGLLHLVWFEDDVLVTCTVHESKVTRPSAPERRWVQ
jgi:hypothetical protein